MANGYGGPFPLSEGCRSELLRNDARNGSRRKPGLAGCFDDSAAGGGEGCRCREMSSCTFYIHEFLVCDRVSSAINKGPFSLLRNMKIPRVLHNTLSCFPCWYLSNDLGETSSCEEPLLAGLEKPCGTLGKNTSPCAGLAPADGKVVL